MSETGLSNSILLRVNSLLAMAGATKDGLGVCALPCYLGDCDPELKRVTKIIPELSTDLWLLTHCDLRKNVRIRIFMDYLYYELKKTYKKIEGDFNAQD